MTSKHVVFVGHLLFRSAPSYPQSQLSELQVLDIYSELNQSIFVFQ
ncbi:hypothetical protein BFV94_4033 [Alteromonas macleodii]|uniref:Uncharacterized protein n=1 Tax=Alteromonas macleodii TaxID=28108 RepID=A0AB36FSZ2_ALTMA|nr:hypothetical protein BFV95_4042 [Alteromonas macleodii]OES26655.1 hypothetical protein BFV94_4033 [Alteromonas macleodii]OES39423.1 hypothetical protein BFV96_4023 [Alteromonas macleodii]